MRLGLAGAKPLQLLVLINVNPEFQQHDAVADQFVFELGDLAIGPLPFSVTGQAFDPFDQHSPVPTAVEYRDLAVAWHASPESPQVMVCVFFRRGCRKWIHLKAPGIHGLGQTADRAALAAGVGALKDQYRGLPAFQAQLLKLSQTRLQGRQSLFVLLARQSLVEVELL